MPLDASLVAPHESSVGLVFEQKRALRPTKRGVCIGQTEHDLELHFSAKETTRVPRAGLLASESIPRELAPAGRLMLAGRAEADTGKQDWDRDLLRGLAGELAASSHGECRALAQESLARDWTDVFEDLPLSVSEKTWLMAQRAASARNAEHVLHYVSYLPEQGYDVRVGLAWPFLPHLAQNAARWLPLVDRWIAAGLEGAERLRTAAFGAWAEAMAANADQLRELGYAERAEAWLNARSNLESRTPTAPLVASAPAWRSAATVTRGLAGDSIDARVADLDGLPAPLIDDLVDSGVLTVGADTRQLSHETAWHLLARLKPQALTDQQLSAVGHTDELARRYLVRRDQTSLDSLPDHQTVRHFRGLLHVVMGQHPDPEMLSPDVAALFDEAAASRNSIRSGDARIPGTAVLSDPTLWPLVSEEAREGMIQPSDEDRVLFKDFTQWCDLQRLVGHVWASDWPAADQLGRRLIAELTVERYQDEALNLTAFALHQQGRHEEALGLLERALEGLYTEALLINTSLLAALVQPADAAKYFARIVRDAPSTELRRVAVLRAVNIWMDLPPDVPFPAELSEPLKETIQAPADIEEYIRLLRVADLMDSRWVLGLTSPSDERRGPLTMRQALIRFRDDPGFDQADLVSAYVKVYRDQGRTPWFESSWTSLVEDFRSVTFVDFGDAPGAAVFWDTVNVQAPELLTPFQRLVLVPQAGAHFSAHFARDESVLSDAAWSKFLFIPCEELLASRGAFDDAQFQYLVDNMSLTFYVAAVNYADTRRSTLASSYNEWLQRYRWDSQNAYAIRVRLHEILEECSSSINLLDRVIERLNRLPTDDGSSGRRAQLLAEGVNDWRSEVVRLRANL